jgi:hypothetical protein
MPRTLTQTCALCGLRYANSALLELHIREDHVQQNQRAAPARGDTAGSMASQARAGASRSSAPDAGLPRPKNMMAAGTATTRPRRRLRGSVVAALRRTERFARRAVQAVRYVNQELLRAAEALSLRRVPEPHRPQRPADTGARPASQATEPTKRAA